LMLPDCELLLPHPAMVKARNKRMVTLDLRTVPPRALAFLKNPEVSVELPGSIKDSASLDQKEVYGRVEGLEPSCEWLRFSLYCAASGWALRWDGNFIEWILGRSWVNVRCRLATFDPHDRPILFWVDPLSVGPYLLCPSRDHSVGGC
jgi:hypothetical protein